MDYTIYPYEGVGPIRFGMTPQQIHEILGEPDRVLPGYEAKFPTDSYHKIAIHVDYDESGACDISLYDSDAKPIFREQVLFGQTFGELKPWFQSLKTDIQHYDSGLIFLKFGVSLYSPHYVFPHRDPYSPVEVIGVSSHNYIEKWASHNAKEYRREYADCSEG